MEDKVPSPSTIYFFMDNDLYRVIKTIKSKDELIAWSYKDAARKLYSWTWVQRSKEYAFTLADTARLIDRPKMRIEAELRKGTIPKPHCPYNLKTGEDIKLTKLYSESDILEIHDVFLNMHKGHPRKDEIEAPAPMPSRQDLINMMQHKLVTYVKNGDTFVPIWKAGNW